MELLELGVHIKIKMKITGAIISFFVKNLHTFCLLDSISGTPTLISLASKIDSLYYCSSLAFLSSSGNQIANIAKIKGNTAVTAKIFLLSTYSRSKPPVYAVINIPKLRIPKKRDTFLEASYYL